MINKQIILFMTTISILTMLVIGPMMAVAHASILGDCGIGYQAGKQQAYNDFPNQYNEASPYNGVDGKIAYNSCYQTGYEWEWMTLKAGQP